MADGIAMVLKCFVCQLQEFGVVGCKAIFIAGSKAKVFAVGSDVKQVQSLESVYRGANGGKTCNAAVPHDAKIRNNANTFTIAECRQYLQHLRRSAR